MYFFYFVPLPLPRSGQCVLSNSYFYCAPVINLLNICGISKRFYHGLWEIIGAVICEKIVC